MSLELAVECTNRAGTLAFDDFGFVVEGPEADWVCLCPVSASGFETVTSSPSQQLRAGLEQRVRRWLPHAWEPTVPARLTLDVRDELTHVGDEAVSWPFIACFQSDAVGFAFAGPYSVALGHRALWRELAEPHWLYAGDPRTPVCPANGVGPACEQPLWTAMLVPRSSLDQVRLNCGAWTLTGDARARLHGGWAASLLCESREHR